jgi:hypothetical protein
LDDESLRNSVALWALWFAQLKKEMEQMLLMEKIRATKLVLGDDMRQNDQNAPLYFIPFLTELPEVATECMKNKCAKLSSEQRLKTRKHGGMLMGAQARRMAAHHLHLY